MRLFADRAFRAGLVAVSAVVVSACGASSPATNSSGLTTPQATLRPMYPPVFGSDARTFRKGGGYRKLGAPYQIGGHWYYPAENPGYDETGTASWYGTKVHGKPTANNEIFDANALTAAHPTLPLPSYLEVTNLANGRKLVVRLNDRGPFLKNRIVDLSYGAAKLLGYVQQGTTQTRVRYLGPAPLNGDDTRERRSADKLRARLAQR
jgi:rare lipoprotein A